MAIDFPNSPVQGSTYSYLGITYTYEDTGGGTGFWKVSTPGNTGIATSAEVDTGTNNSKYLTPLAIDGSKYGVAYDAAGTAATANTGTGANDVPTNADVRNLRNLIINPSFAIWQEGNTVLVPSNTVTYTADQYFCFAAGASLNATKSVDDSAQTCAALTGVGSPTLVSFGQRIEGSNAPRNTTELTLSFRVLMPTLDELTWDLTSANTLDDFSAQTSIGTGTFGTLAAGWHDLEVTIPATSAQLDNGYQIAIVLPNGLATTNVLKYSEVAIYKGNVPREFQPNSYAQDLAECQRYGFNPLYLEATDFEPAFGTGAGTTTVNISLISIKTPVPLRNTPSLLLKLGYTSGDFEIFDGSNVPLAVSDYSMINESSTSLIQLLVTSTTDPSNHRPYWIRRNNTISRELFISARL